MKLDDRIRELIAVGTAVGANCHSCLEYHFGKAREEGIPNDEIAESVEVGKLVRKGAQGKMDKLAMTCCTKQRPRQPTHPRAAAAMNSRSI